MRIDYDTYMSSKEWYNLKGRHKAAGLASQCLSCSRTDKLTLHHRTYKRFGNEDLTDLIPLCWECHKSVHDYNIEHGVPLSKIHITLMRMNKWTQEYTRDKLLPYYLVRSFKFKSKKKKQVKRKKKAHWSDAFKEFPEYDHLKFIR